MQNRELTHASTWPDQIVPKNGIVLVSLDDNVRAWSIVVRAGTVTSLGRRWQWFSCIERRQTGASNGRGHSFLGHADLGEFLEAL